MKVYYLLMVFLAGCGLTAGMGRVVRITDLSSEEIARANTMRIYKSGAFPASENLGRIEGLSCAALAEERVSEIEALEQLKIKAAKLGATAVTNVACQYNGEIDWQSNCWRTYVCVGDALQTQR